MSTINVNAIDKESGSTLTLGTSGTTVDIPSGATIDATGATVTGFGLFSSYAIIADQKTQNTAGGTFTLGAWRTRDLNTEIVDPDGIVSIASNQFTLGAGSYLIRWACPAFGVYYQQSRLYNSTDSSVEGISMSTYSNQFQVSQGSIRLVITGSKTFEIQHRSNTTYPNEGFGRPANLGTEQYAIVEIYKEA